ncbi:hypothetical protein [Streptomyces sp. NPDC001621]|uniref:hypothetical protein n=1 Tax=Streptomyces sp. NPDC001621 TaxID=3364594 RepID=UPI00367EC981
MVLVYVAFALMTAGDEFHASPGWTDTAHVLAPIFAAAPWPLTALTLLWLARRHPAVYVRGAIALLLSSVAGLALSVAVSLQSVPVREGSVVRDYPALPGVLTGWYLLLALAVFAGACGVWARFAVTVIALPAVAASVVTADHPLLATVWAVGVPLVAWYPAGRLQDREGARRRGAVDAAEPQGAGFRPRVEASGPRPVLGSVPLRQAG